MSRYLLLSGETCLEGKGRRKGGSGWCLCLINDGVARARWWAATLLPNS